MTIFPKRNVRRRSNKSTLTAKLQFKSILLNEPRTAKVGAISKAQNCERGDPSGFVKLQLVAKYEKKLKGGPFGDFKKFLKKFLKKVIFEQCHSAKKCKRGDTLRFFDIHWVAKCQNNWRGTLWCNPKNFKKSGAKVGSLVCFRGSGRVLFFLFVLNALLRFECFEPP